MNIAIDGPSGAGKSCLAKGIAKHFGMIYVDTGALYRAIGLFVKRKGIATGEIEKIKECLPEISLKIAYEAGEQHVYLGAEDVSKEIRMPEISMYASAVSAVPEVRTFLLDTQRDMAKKSDVVMDGRDIGTVILPDAEVKIFLVASGKDRAVRRYEELKEKGIDTTLEEVEADMSRRDDHDRNREIAPAVAAKDAVLLDNSGLKQEETLALAIKIVEDKLKK